MNRIAALAGAAGILLAAGAALAASATVEVICLESPCVLIVGRQTYRPAQLERQITLSPGQHSIVAWDQPTGMQQIRQVTVHDAHHPARVVFNLLDAHDDRSPPLITHAPCDDFAIGEPVTIRAIFSDDRDLFEPRIYYRFDAERSWAILPMLAQTRGNAATIPARRGVAKLSYYVEVFDDLGNGPGELGNADAPITLPAISVASECDQLGEEMVPSLFSVMTVGRSQCHVFVAGERLGMAPLFKQVVPPGEHDVEVQCPDGGRYETRVLFAESAEEKLIVKPEMIE